MSTPTNTHLKPIGKGHARINFPLHSKLAVAEGNFYVIVPETDNLRILTLSTVNNLLSPVSGIPVFDNETQSAELSGINFGYLSESWSKIAVGSATFYAEYKGELFRWRSSYPEWTNTGLLDTSYTTW